MCCYAKQTLPFFSFLFLFFCNSAGKDIVYMGHPPPHTHTLWGPHMPVKTAGMSLCFVTLLKWGYCWLLIKRISLFSHNGKRNADCRHSCNDDVIYCTSTLTIPTTKPTASLPLGVPSHLNRQNNAAHMLGCVVNSYDCYYEKKLQHVRHMMKAAPVQK